MNISLESITSLTEQFGTYIIEFAPKIIFAGIAAVGGWYAIKYIIIAMNKLFHKTKIDPTVSKFLISMARIVLQIMLFIIVANMLGVSMTSFVAILGAAGLAIGLSLQGSLSNFSGGIFLLAFKPYKVGDVVKIGDHVGTIKEVSIMYTTLIALDETTVIFPNGSVVNDTIVNMTSNGMRRIDIPVSIAYNADLDLAKKVLTELITNHEKVLLDEPYGVFVSSLGESSVDLVVRVVVQSADFLSVKFDLTEHIKKTLDTYNIEIPFPQRVVHMKTIA